MEIKEKTNQKRFVDNSAYKERFQFIVSVDDNIICQRYFKIPKFDPNSLTSKELFEVLDGYHGKGQEQLSYFAKDRMGVVQLIQRELEDKSRVYTIAENVDCKCKLTGFAKDENGNPINEVTYAEWEPKPYDEGEFVEPWGVVFKFEFLVDDNVVYSRIWDGSQYPKYVRNSVDLTNGKSDYPMVRYMNAGRKDLVVEIISRICGVCSNGDEDKTLYTKSDRYTNDARFIECTMDSNSDSKIDENGKKYSYSVYNREYVNSWREYILKKYGPEGLNNR